MSVSLAGILCFAAAVREMRGELAEMSALAEESVSLSEAGGFPVYQGAALVIAGYAETKLGGRASGLARIQEGFGILGKTGTQLYAPWFLSRLVEAYQDAGRSEEALATVDVALALARRNVDSYYEPGLLHLRGELLLSAADDAGRKAGEAHFREALERARSAGALMLELRAATSFARLRRAQGRAEEGRALLAPLYAAFHEGLDTRDLRAARALLDELGGPAA